MTIERFKEILKEEGLPEENIESIIKNKPDFLDWDTLDEDAARMAATMTVMAKKAGMFDKKINIDDFT